MISEVSEFSTWPIISVSESNLIGIQIMSSKRWKGFQEEMKALKQGKKGGGRKGTTGSTVT